MVEDKSDDLTHHDEKFTDGNVQILFPWTVDGNANTGTFKVQVNVSVLGYQDSNKSDSFIVIPAPAAAAASSIKEVSKTVMTDNITENPGDTAKSPQGNPKPTMPNVPHTPITSMVLKIRLRKKSKKASANVYCHIFRNYSLT
jgi:hypothetical protein